MLNDAVPGRGSRLLRHAWVWVPALLAVLAFARAVPGGFMIDDAWYVSENPGVARPTAGEVLRILDPRGQGRHRLEYVPLVNLSFMGEAWLQRQVARMLGNPEARGLNPSGYHLTQSLLYGLTALLASLLIARLTGSRPLAGLTGALFALHPVHAEAVCWISGRKDLLGTVFVLASALAYRMHGEAAGPRRPLLYLAAWLACVAAMMCKATMLVLPGLLGCCDLCFRPAGSRWRLRDALPLLPFVLVAFPFLAIHKMHAVAPYRHLYPQCTGAGLAMEGLLDQVLLTSRSAVLHLQLAVLPLRGRIYYSDPFAGWTAPQALSVLGVSAWILLALRLGLRCLRGGARPGERALGLGLLWTGIALFPACNPFVHSIHLAALRYLFLPSLGLSLVAAAGILALFRTAPRRAWAAGLGLAAAFLVLDGAAASRWREDGPLLRQALREDPRDPIANRAFGRLAAMDRRWGEALRRYRRTAVCFELPGCAPEDRLLAATDTALVLVELGRAQEALTLLEAWRTTFPTRPELLEALGRALICAGRVPEAEEVLVTRTRLAPGSPAAWVDLGILLNNLHRFREALGAFERAAALTPGAPVALLHLAAAHQNLGDAEAAEAALRRAMAAGVPDAREQLVHLQLSRAQAWLERRRRPDPLAARDWAHSRALVLEAATLAGPSPGTERLLGSLAREARDAAGAERHLRRARALRDDAEARLALAESLREKGVRAMMGKDPETAYAAYREALDLFPPGSDTSGVRVHLRMVSEELLRQRFQGAVEAFAAGRLEEARRGFGSALEIRPGFFEANLNLGLVCLHQRDWEAAVVALREACEARPEDFEACLRLGDALEGFGLDGDAQLAFRRALGLAQEESQRETAASRLSKKP